MTSFYKLSNLDKELWPKITKKDLINYLLYVGPVLKEYLKGKPLALLRAPDGINKASFVQKNLPDFAPPTIKTWEFKHQERITRFMLLNSNQDLVYLGNQACVEIHSWLSTIYEWDKPCELVIDLDPKPEVEYKYWQQAAFMIYELLLKIGLSSYPKLTGRKGIHIMIPLTPQYSYKELSPFLKALKELIVHLWPDLFTTELRKDKRAAPIFLDLGQNGLEKTVIAPYSPRFEPHGPVAISLSWESFAKMKEKPFWGVKKKDWPPLNMIPTLVQKLPDLFLGADNH